jgi:hypothetical protein
VERSFARSGTLVSTGRQFESAVRALYCLLRRFDSLIEPLKIFECENNLAHHYAKIFLEDCQNIVTNTFSTDPLR